MIEMTELTIVHIEAFNSLGDTALLRSKLLGISGIREVRCAPTTQSVTVTHDPARASVELILWVVRETGFRATVLHRAVCGQGWRWTATASLVLGATLLLCHWPGMPRWLEMAVLLATVVTVIGSFLVMSRNITHGGDNPVINV